MTDPTLAPEPPVDSEQDRHLPWLLILFVGSGCAALIYEVVWLQLLQLVIGLTSISLGILLGTFMGGMCLGSLFLARVVRQQHHPLRVYAYLELGIGLIGIAELFVVPWLAGWYAAVGGRGLSGFILRGLLAGLCLLPPTVLMGATLPAAARWIQTTRQGVSWLGLFYGGNIAGAVVGCLLAGFYLLPVFNMAMATYVAAAINGVVAFLAFAIAFKSGHSCCSPAAGVASTNPPGPWLIYGAIALSGTSALGAEVIWTRLMALLLGGTVYTFSIILSVFLIGLGTGSTAGAVLARSVAAPRLVLGGCQLLLTAAIAWAALLLAHSIPFWPINPALAASRWDMLQLDFARTLWTIFPAAVLWGASFPLALAAVAAPGQDPAKIVGRLYAANTLGAILGALGFSLGVIPWVGTQGGERLLVGLSLCAALLALAPGRASSVVAVDGSARARRRPLWPIAAALAGIALAVVLAWNISPAPWGLVAYGRFMATWANRLAPGIVAPKDVPRDNRAADIFCTYLGEGLNGSVAVTEWTSGVRSFHSAGKVQASTEWRDMRLQRMLGHLSALAHPKPKSVLVVACGAGVTAGTFVLYPSVKRIVICDIEPLVPKFVAPMFTKENYGVVTDPRTEVASDDGRHFIRTSKEKFDIITSDPIDPWVKGCAALNTVDYYQMCKDHLNPGGVMSLWIPLYENNVESVKSVIATFFKVFPNGTLWSNDSDGEGYDAVLFGQAEPTQFDLDALHDRLLRADHARVKQSLQDVGFNSLNSLLATYAGQSADLQDWVRDGQINTDANLRLQYLAGRWLNSYQGPEILASIKQHYRFPEQLFLGAAPRRKILRLTMEGLSASP